MNTLTLPIKLINDLAQHNYEKLAEKIKKIPDDKIHEVEPEIGVPLIEKLSYTKNEDLVNAYINLLASASNKDKINLVHPGFIAKINSMAPDEAKILDLMKDKNEILYIYYNRVAHDDGFNRVTKNLTGIEKKLKISTQRLQIHLDNLVALNIIKDRYPLTKSNQNKYIELLDMYSKENDDSEINKLPSNYKLQIEKSFYSITDIGRTFIDACIQ